VYQPKFEQVSPEYKSRPTYFVSLSADIKMTKNY